MNHPKPPKGLQAAAPSTSAWEPKSFIRQLEGLNYTQLLRVAQVVGQNSTNPQRNWQFLPVPHDRNV